MGREAAPPRRWVRARARFAVPPGKAACCRHSWAGAVQEIRPAGGSPRLASSSLIATGGLLGAQTDLVHEVLVVPEQPFVIHHAVFPVSDRHHADREALAGRRDRLAV